MKNTLDSDKGQAYLRKCSRRHRSRCVSSTLILINEEHMGSTIFGNVTPVIGSALPQDIKINRAGFRRVRGDGRT